MFTFKKITFLAENKDKILEEKSYQVSQTTYDTIKALLENDMALETQKAIAKLCNNGQGNMDKKIFINSIKYHLLEIMHNDNLDILSREYTLKKLSKLSEQEKKDIFDLINSES